MRSAPAADAWDRPGADLLADYDARLVWGSRGKHLRRVAAQQFVARWPDIRTWMARPTPARIADVERTGA